MALPKAVRKQARRVKKVGAKKATAKGVKKVTLGRKIAGGINAHKRETEAAIAAAGK